MTTLYDLHELEALCERQRQALDELLKETGSFLSTPWFIKPFRVAKLRAVYLWISSLSTMTGSSEK